MAPADAAVDKSYALTSCKLRTLGIKFRSRNEAGGIC